MLEMKNSRVTKQTKFHGNPIVLEKYNSNPQNVTFMLVLKVSRSLGFIDWMSEAHFMTIRSMFGHLIYFGSMWSSKNHNHAASTVKITSVAQL